MAGIYITDIEAAINHWRSKNPSADGVALPPELRALAEVYGLMVYHRQDLADEFSLPLAAAQAWQDWYASTPDTQGLRSGTSMVSGRICTLAGLVE